MIRSKSRLPGSRAAVLFSAILTASCEDVHASPRGAAAPVQRASAVTAAPARPTGAELLRGIALERASLLKTFQSARTDAARVLVRKKAIRYLERTLIDDVLPRWNGTPWSFSGTSTTPGQGSIACGYFVSTTLEEAGLRVERARLAQQASEDIIKSLVPPGAITRYSDVPVEKFTAAVAARGDGLYVVGLDNHVGFLVVKGGEVLFHHASYVDTVKVVREEAALASPLAGSRYRVVGKLFTDDALIDAWILGSPVATKIRTKTR